MVPAMNSVWMCWALFVTLKNEVCPWLCVTHLQFEYLARCELGVLWSQCLSGLCETLQETGLSGLFCKSVNLSSAMAAFNEQRGGRIGAWGGRIGES